MDRGAREVLETIRGLIIPARWDETGDVIAVVISTFDEDFYGVEDDETTRRLLCFLRHEVEARGTVKRRGGRKTIRIENFVVTHALDEQPCHRPS